MNGESKFNPGYEYLNDKEIFDLQDCLDRCWDNLKSLEVQKSARLEFPGKLKSLAVSCAEGPERGRLLMNFLQDNLRMLYAGGIGKDISNPIVVAFKKAIDYLEGQS